MINRETLLDMVLEAIAGLIEYELAVILSLEDEQLVVQRSAGPLATGRLDSYAIDLRKRGDLGTLLNSGKPYVFPENEDHQDTYEGVVDLPDGHSCLVAPLQVDAKPIGLLTLDHSICGKFSPGVVSSVAVLARLIALVLAEQKNSERIQAINQQLTYERNLLLGREKGPLSQLKGASPPWLQVLEQLKMVASSSVPVLIGGETGTGKEEAAQAIHNLSQVGHGDYATLFL